MPSSNPNSKEGTIFPYIELISSTNRCLLSSKLVTPCNVEAIIKNCRIGIVMPTRSSLPSSSMAIWHSITLRWRNLKITSKANRQSHLRMCNRQNKSYKFHRKRISMESIYLSTFLTQQPKGPTNNGAHRPCSTV